MAIVQSVILEDRVQVDGRRQVTERHTDSTGVNHDITYVAEAAADANAAMAARVSIIEARLRDWEIERNLARAYVGLSNFTFNHSTVAQTRTAARERFRTATKIEAITWGWAIHNLNLSDNQLKALFERTDAQLPALKARLAELAAKYEDIDNEAGE